MARPSQPRGVSEPPEVRPRTRTRKPTRKHVFNRLATRAAQATGSFWAFTIALTVVLAWALTGPIFKFSDTWQLAINTGTTVVTFLMVFLIQHAQNRDSRAVQLKLDELLAAVEGASNRLINVEALDEEELRALQRRFEILASHAGDMRGGKATSVDAPSAKTPREGRQASKPARQAKPHA